jgi:hypothetical protein
MTENSSRISLLCAAVSLLAVFGFYMLREHWGHALGLFPYALLLACPLMHLLHRHGRHDKSSGD